MLIRKGIILFLCWALIMGLPLSAFADSETLVCDGDPPPDGWNTTGTGCEVTYDASDATYLSTGTSAAVDYFTIANTAFTWTSIDSVNMVFRWGGKNTKEIPFAMDLLTTDSISGTLVDKAAVGPFDSTISYATKPGGGGWVQSALDSIGVQVRAGTIGGGGELRCHEFSIVIWGTKAASGGTGQVIIIGGDD